MSLSSVFNHHGSIVGQYLWQRYHNTSRLARVANTQLAQAGTVRPQAEAYPWAVVARAVGYRLRFCWGMMPLRDLLAWRGAQMLAQTPEAPYPQATIATLFAELEAAIARIAPAGRQPDDADEAEMARICYLLGLCEDVYRAGQFVTTPLLDPALPRTLPGWLALPPALCVADIALLARRFMAEHETFLAQPATLFPTFGGMMPHGSALGPLIIGDGLYLIKATTHPAIEARWLRDLAGYALLDERDTYHLRQVGIIAPRQGMVLRWPANDFIAALAETPAVNLQTLRREFAAVRRAISPSASAALAVGWAARAGLRQHD